jgi:hypothetical protein
LKYIAQFTLDESGNFLLSLTFFHIDTNIPIISVYNKIIFKLSYIFYYLCPVKLISSC